jgi:hypothetical protein
MPDLDLKIPPDRLTLDAKLTFCEIVREKLRREHNAQGLLFATGKLSKAAWEAYLANEFVPKNDATSVSLLAVRATPKDAARALADSAPAMLAVDLKTVFAAKATL